MAKYGGAVVKIALTSPAVNIPPTCLKMIQMVKKKTSSLKTSQLMFVVSVAKKPVTWFRIAPGTLIFALKSSPTKNYLESKRSRTTGSWMLTRWSRLPISWRSASSCLTVLLNKMSDTTRWTPSRVGRWSLMTSTMINSTRTFLFKKIRVRRNNKKMTTKHTLRTISSIKI